MGMGREGDGRSDGEREMGGVMEMGGEGDTI